MPEAPTAKQKARRSAQPCRHGTGADSVAFLSGAELHALDLRGTQATGADIHALMRAVHNRFHPTDVGFPGSVGLAVRVGHIVTEHNAFAADITFCHRTYLPETFTPRGCYLSKIYSKTKSRFIFYHMDFKNAIPKSNNFCFFQSACDSVGRVPRRSPSFSPRPKKRAVKLLQYTRVSVRII